MVANMIRQGEVVTQEDIINLKSMYGLDRPFVVQYFGWFKGILTGNWGTSYYYNQAVLVKIKRDLGHHLMISFVTLVFTYIIAVPIAYLLGETPVFYW